MKISLRDYDFSLSTRSVEPPLRKTFIWYPFSSLYTLSTSIHMVKQLMVAVIFTAGVGGYAYLLEPLWWAGMITMIVGEVSNFVAYIYAPAVLVTPLGALSIIISAVLAHFMLRERLQRLGAVGCILCIVGSVVIVIHASQEHMPTSVQEIWILAIQPAFVIYVAATISIVVALMFHYEPRYGQTNMLIYLGICSLIGALTVIMLSSRQLQVIIFIPLVEFLHYNFLGHDAFCRCEHFPSPSRCFCSFFVNVLYVQLVSIKAIGIAIKLTLEGISQTAYPQTWFSSCCSNLYHHTVELSKQGYLHVTHWHPSIDIGTDDSSALVIGRNITYLLALILML